MSAEAPLEPQWDAAHDRIRTILTQARSRAWQAVNVEIVAAYWEIDRVIAEEGLRGAARADYGKQVVAALSRRLSQEFGKRFDRSNLWNMRTFHHLFPILDALRRESTWTHYRLPLRVGNPRRPRLLGRMTEGAAQVHLQPRSGFHSRVDRPSMAGSLWDRAAAHGFPLPSVTLAFPRRPEVHCGKERGTEETVCLAFSRCAG